jgi:hypothetical protein
MTNYPYVLFNKSPLQLRALGARGGRAYGRNQRRRRALLALLPVPIPTVPPCATPGPTAAEAVALLDAQFPWLRAAEKRGPGMEQHPRTAPGRRGGTDPMRTVNDGPK